MPQALGDIHFYSEPGCFATCCLIIVSVREKCCNSKADLEVDVLLYEQ